MEKTLGQCCSCALQFVQGHILEKAQKKALMLAHCDVYLVDKFLTGFVGAPHKASFFVSYVSLAVVAC